MKGETIRPGALAQCRACDWYAKCITDRTVTGNFNLSIADVTGKGVVCSKFRVTTPLGSVEVQRLLTGGDVSCK
jgi:hypothetical protein